MVSVRRGVDPRRFAAPRLRRRGRPPRHRRGPAARDRARRRAAGGGRPLGLGDAGHRSPLRGGADPHRRRAAGGRGDAAPGLRHDGDGGPAAAGRGLLGPGARSSARSTCATASRSSRSTSRWRDVDLEAPDVDDGDRRALPPAPRGALHLRGAGPGGRAGERAPGGGRRAAGPARGARAAPRRAPAAPRSRRRVVPGRRGARCRSTISTRWRRGRRSTGPAIVEAATTTALLRAGRARDRHARSAGSTSGSRRERVRARAPGNGG